MTSMIQIYSAILSLKEVIENTAVKWTAKPFSTSDAEFLHWLISQLFFEEKNTVVTINFQTESKLNKLLHT